MTTLLALAQARHQQAIAALVDAEAELLAAMRAIEPSFTGTVAAMQDRRWESRLEGIRPHWELSMAYGRYRRAQRAEAKARSAANRARWAERQEIGNAVTQSDDLDPAEVYRRLLELRAA